MADTTKDATDVQPQTIDPLRRVFIPIEKKASNGVGVFQTLDGEKYARLSNGAIRLVQRKRKGKKARSDDRVHRRLLRRAKQKELHGHD